MFRTPAWLLAVLVTVALIGGTTITAASASPARSSRQGTEHLVLMDTSTRSLVFSVLATGVFTDGGTINADTAGNQARIRLGSGTIELRTRDGSARYHFSRATCLQTLTGRGTYTLSHGTGRYAGIRGSGKFTTSRRSVLRRRPDGTCARSRPLAAQSIVTLHGPVTIRG